MKKQYIFSLFLALACGMGVTSCSDDDNNTPQEVETKNAEPKIFFDDISEVTGNSATINAFVQEGAATIMNAGFVYSELQNPTLLTEETKRIDLGAVEAPVMLSHQIKGLQTSTAYNAVAYVVTATDTIYSAMVPFTTGETPDEDAPVFLPVFDLYDVQTVTYNTADLYGKVVETGSGDFVEFGFVVSENEPPTIVDMRFPIADDFLVNTPFMVHATGMEAYTTYYVRMYYMTEDNITYSDVKTFMTPEAPVIQPAATIAAATNVEETTATLNANITEPGNLVVYAHGFVYGTAAAPTVDDKKVTLGGDPAMGAVSKAITGLTASTTYYVRYFVQTSSDVIYSDETSFTTEAPAAVDPAAALADVAEVTKNSASFSATITAIGNQTVEEYGFCYATTDAPTMDDTKLVVSDAFAATTVTMPVADLTAETTYYVRFYIKVADKVIYTDAKSFTTEPEPADETPSVPITETGTINGLGTGGNA